MIKTDEFWLKSECGNGYLHRFKLQRQWINCVEEVCEICGQAEFFTINEGRIDNMAYIEYHMRQCLPKEHDLFFHEYQYEPSEIL